MRFHTIDQNYDYQMGNAINQLLKDFERTADEFSPEELLDFVAQKKQYFGEIIFNHMREWTTEADWYEQVTE